jgi:hypothetical protein
MAEPLLPGELRHNKFLFDSALKLLTTGLIVEIGCIRDTQLKAKQADGWSTLRWLEHWVATKKNPIVSVDINEFAILKSRVMLTTHSEHHAEVTFITADGCVFLANCVPNSIGLLYLDGPDPNEDGQRLCKTMLEEALPALTPDALILIDDCDFTDNGKGRYAIPFALEVGFKVIENNTRQQLLRRKN